MQKSTIRLRPTFCLDSDLGPDDVLEQVRCTVDRNSEDVIGQFKNGHVTLSIVEPKRHFWSPWLSLEIRETQSGSEVFGRYSPHPSIWTGIMFAYLSLAVLMFFSLIAGTSQFLAAQSATAFLLVPVWAVAAATLWLVSQAGQKLAHDEMTMMTQIVLRSLPTNSNQVTAD